MALIVYILFSSVSKPYELMVNKCTPEKCGNLQHDLQMLRNERLEFNKNPLVSYLNINSLRNKIIGLKEIIQYLNLDYFVSSETRIVSTFPSAEFAIDNYKIKACRDRNCNGGRLIGYVRKGIISRKLKENKLLTVKLLVQKYQSQRKNGFILVSTDRHSK